MTITFKSPFPDLPIPEDASLWNKLELHVREIGDKPALICGMTERTLSFAEMHNQALRICASLAMTGIKRGDVVILHSFNCLEYPIVFLALNRLGAICSMSSPQFNSEELTDQIQSSGAIAVITHLAFTKVAVQAAAFSGIPRKQVITLGHPKGIPGLQTIESFIAKNLPFPDLPRINPHDVVMLPYSSGTTGRPKGVELTAHAMYACGARLSNREEFADYVLAVLPFFHTSATMIFHATIFKGVTMIILPRFEPGSFLRVVEKYKLNTVNIAPPIIQILAKHPIVDKYDLSSLNRMASWGTPLGEELQIAIRNRLGVPVLQGYDLIKYKGHQVAPAEIEDAVNSHPQVVDSCCVRGFDLVTGEEIPKAFVVVKLGGAAPLTADALMEYVAAKVAGYKRVREVEFIVTIPKSLSGKTLRHKLQLLQGEKATLAATALFGYQALGEAIAEVGGIQPHRVPVFGEGNYDNLTPTKTLEYAIHTAAKCHPHQESAGRLLPNVEMKVKDLDTDEDFPMNKTGELLFRTPSMMKGYYNDPEANRVTFTKDGFICTGDVSYIDHDGYMFIVDRLKELIKYKGYHVAPTELEDVLNHHPALADTICARGFDATTGEATPKAFVALKDGDTSLTKEDLTAFVTSKVAVFKRVRELGFISAIPKGASGKMLRKELQQMQDQKVEQYKSRLRSGV
ncbi:hypothetical protein JM16_001163 [Phytophthora kernoviae]|uniref:AMP-dependent synthetase/ligase domain-containing protein n=1 Tax=Phytophthora kernoviae TaxID=325452 RepID=A0A8T0M872_9STRA|nr:hypothetical protein JM16_001163 [Phytophthora kernoviae]